MDEDEGFLEVRGGSFIVIIFIYPSRLNEERGTPLRLKYVTIVIVHICAMGTNAIPFIT